MSTRTKGRELHCKCGKLLAIERDGKVYIQCRRCKEEVLVGLSLPREKSPRVREQQGLNPAPPQ